MRASDCSAPGPEPNITRPRVMWSSCTIRSAIMNGWWYGTEITPVPSRMWRVCCEAIARKISGEPMIS